MACATKTYNPLQAQAKPTAAAGKRQRRKSGEGAAAVQHSGEELQLAGLLHLMQLLANEDAAAGDAGQVRQHADVAGFDCQGNRPRGHPGPELNEQLGSALCCWKLMWTLVAQRRGVVGQRHVRCLRALSCPGDVQWCPTITSVSALPGIMMVPCK